MTDLQAFFCPFCGTDFAVPLDRPVSCPGCGHFLAYDGNDDDDNS